MPYAQLRGRRVFFVDAGARDAPPVVLLHGLGASAEDWDYQIPVFAQRFRVIAIDFAGFGRSDRRGPYGVRSFARDVWLLLEQLDIRRFVLMGHSMGGAVAQEMALEQPLRITHLVLANTMPSFVPETLDHQFMLWSRLMIMSVLGPARLAEAMSVKLFPSDEHLALRERVIRRGRTNVRSAYLASVWSLTRWSARHRLHTLGMPVLLVAAEHDYFSRADFERFKEAMPSGARMEIIPGTRHALPLERPDLFNARVLSFLGAA